MTTDSFLTQCLCVSSICYPKMSVPSCLNAIFITDKASWYNRTPFHCIFIVRDSNRPCCLAIIPPGQDISGSVSSCWVSSWWPSLPSRSTHGTPTAAPPRRPPRRCQPSPKETPTALMGTMKTVVTAATGQPTTTTVLIIPSTHIPTPTHIILHIHIIRHMEDIIILLPIPFPKISMLDAAATRGWCLWPWRCWTFK